MGKSSDFATSNSSIKYNITVTQNSQNLEENYSDVTVKVNFFKTGSGSFNAGQGTLYCEINSALYEETTTFKTAINGKAITSSGVDLFSPNMRIRHKTNGQRQLICKVWISTTTLTSDKHSYIENLTTIPKTNQVSFSSDTVTMGNNVTIYTNRSSNDLTHVLYADRGNGWQVIASNVGSSYTWTVPMSYANSVPKSDTLKFSVWCEAYKGSSYIGNSHASMLATVPSSVKPTISGITLSERVYRIEQDFGVFIQGKSKLEGVISASGAYSSTIEMYNIEINSEKTKYADISDPRFTTDELTGSGSLPVTVKVRDSRGRTATRTEYYNVEPYSAPVVNKFTVVRANSSGQADVSGTYALCTINASISSVDNKNDKLFWFKYKKSTDLSYTEVYLSSNNYTYNGTYLVSGMDVDYEYDFVFYASDYFGSTTYEARLPSGFTLVDYRNTGKGMAIGRVSSKDAFQVGIDAEFEKDVSIVQDLDVGGSIDVVDSRTTCANLGLADSNQSSFSGSTAEDWLANVQTYVENNFEPFRPVVFNADWSNQGFGTGLFSQTLEDTSSFGKFLMLFNTKTGVRFHYKTSDASGWKKVSASGADMLYDSSSGTTGTVTLSRSAAYYSTLDIQFRSTTGSRIILRVSNPSGKTVCLNCSDGRTASSKPFITWYTSEAVISGTSITRSNSYRAYGFSNSNVQCLSESCIYITRVIGYI